MVVVYEFAEIAKVSKGALGGGRQETLQMPMGAPSAKHDTAGAVNLGAGTVAIRIVGDGDIDWGGVVESFSGESFRGVEPGLSLTIVA